MLGIVLIYFIGKYFYELAADYNRSKWGFAILGVAAYYVGTFIFGIGLAIGMEIWSSKSMEDLDTFLIGLMAVPFGSLICVGLYHLIKRSWSRKPVLDVNLIDDIEI
jgi:hypothetical protein